MKFQITRIQPCRDKDDDDVARILHHFSSVKNCHAFRSNPRVSTQPSSIFRTATHPGITASSAYSFSLVPIYFPTAFTACRDNFDSFFFCVLILCTTRCGPLGTNRKNNYLCAFTLENVHFKFTCNLTFIFTFKVAGTNYSNRFTIFPGLL